MKLASQKELWLSQSMLTLSIEDLILSVENKNASGLHFRVQKSRDGTLYLYPDEVIDLGQFVGEGLFRYCSDDELNAFQHKGQRLSTLIEALSALTAWRKKHPRNMKFTLNVECFRIEDLGPTLEQLSPLINLGLWQAKNLQLSSSNQPLLQRARRMAPNLGLAVKLSGVPIDYATSIEMLPLAELHLDAESVSESLVRDAVAKGIVVRALYSSHFVGSEAVADLGVEGFVVSEQLVQKLAANERCA